MTTTSPVRLGTYGVFVQERLNDYSEQLKKLKENHRQKLTAYNVLPWYKKFFAYNPAENDFYYMEKYSLENRIEVFAKLDKRISYLVSIGESTIQVEGDNFFWNWVRD